MKPPINIINPITYPAWDDLILACPDYSFFHSSAWARVLSESYGYKPLYFAIVENGRLQAALPVMEVKSFLTGTRGVSLPFSDYCGAIYDSADPLRRLRGEVRAYGRQAHWKYIELRDIDACWKDLEPSDTYYHHTLDLNGDPDRLLAGFRASTRRNINKAFKQGVHAKISHSLDAVKDFYGLHCATRKRHGLPPQPFRFFRNIHKHVISKDLGFILSALYQDHPIAAGVYCHFGKTAMFKYGASDPRYQHLRANNLVMWDAIKHCTQKGCKTFSFGRTDMDHDGLVQFKDGWSTTKQVLKYYRFDPVTEKPLLEPSNGHYFRSQVFNKAPVFLLRSLGALLYRHAG